MGLDISIFDKSENEVAYLRNEWDVQRILTSIRPDIDPSNFYFKLNEITLVKISEKLKKYIKERKDELRNVIDVSEIDLEIFSSFKEELNNIENFYKKVCEIIEILQKDSSKCFYLSSSY